MFACCVFLHTVVCNQHLTKTVVGKSLEPFRGGPLVSGKINSRDTFRKCIVVIMLL